MNRREILVVTFQSQTNKIIPTTKIKLKEEKKRKTG